ncbi:helicase associated domain-containing protein [Streptomyces sp. NPDC048604]|uniref:helicase associated domain-containing protein n=1 Tax=Streptomyces sp. NPDC048604 TaxID=3365578 RepID=UPI00371CAC38
MAAAKGHGKTAAAFQRGLAALAQYIAKEGAHRVPRGHTEEILPDGTAEPVAVRLGVWIPNTKTRRDKLTDPQRPQLAELGVEWA